MEEIISDRRWQRMWHRSNPVAPPQCPAAPGCYVIYLDRQIIYIGQSENLWNRIRKYEIRLVGDRYVTPWGIGDRVEMKYKLSSRYGDWLMREVRLIRRLQPRGNKRGNLQWRPAA